MARDDPGLEIDLFQVVGDRVMAADRDDGLGYGWGWAPLKRPWMDATAETYAYRCLPLTMANQLGIWITNPAGFACMWTGDDALGAIDFMWDEGTGEFHDLVSNHFGHGIITWTMPFLIRTRPAQSRLLVTGPLNQPVPNLTPLAGLIESDWACMTFTMNWRIDLAMVPVRFPAGAPIAQMIPLVRNVAKDMESAKVRKLTIEDDPDVASKYRAWSDSRSVFHQAQRAGKVGPESWQKEYFVGKHDHGESGPHEGHSTKIVYPALTRPPDPRPACDAPGHRSCGY
jgi:hypothetical protein